jgi:hypothetical protein
MRGPLALYILVFALRLSAFLDYINSVCPRLSCLSDLISHAGANSQLHVSSTMSIASQHMSLACEQSRASTHSLADWDAQRQRFTQLYKVEARPLPEVKLLLEKEGNFYATYEVIHLFLAEHS